MKTNGILSVKVEELSSFLDVRERLGEWLALLKSLQPSQHVGSFQEFIADSVADCGALPHAYAAPRCLCGPSGANSPIKIG
ncbi:hypothetical protein GCM10027022_01410 [Alpinimonas psychrophila]